MLTIKDLFDLSHSLAGEWLATLTWPHEALGGIGDLIRALGPSLPAEEYERRGVDIWLHKTADIAPSALIQGPCLLGPGTQVRHCAFIRGDALVGTGCVVGNSTELKNVILFDQVQVPHFNYVGDSILGHKAHMGAGAITANVKADKSPVVIRQGTERLDTGRKKVGAYLGDGAEVGCNAVLGPGAVLGRGAQVYPTSYVRGTVPANHIHKADGTQVARR